MKTRTITSFISSENRQASEQVNNFTIDYPDGILSCRDNEYMELNVLSFDMANSMYNINDNNNKFRIYIDNIIYFKDYTIKAGNYSVKTLRDEINNLIKNIIPVNHPSYNIYLNNINLTINYNEPQNTYSFILKYVLDPATNTPIIGETLPIIYFIPTSVAPLFGISLVSVNILTTPEPYTTGLINLIDYNKIIIHTENIAYYYSNIENIAVKSNRQFLSNIVFWKSKADVLPYQLIKYNNEDGGNSFVYKIENREINSLILQLKNERNELIKDAPNYLLVIQYIFYEKDEYNLLLRTINETLKNIYQLLIFGLNRLNLL